MWHLCIIYFVRCRVYRHDYQCGHQSTFWSVESVLNFSDLTRTGLTHLLPHPSILILSTAAKFLNAAKLSSIKQNQANEALLSLIENKLDLLQQEPSARTSSSLQASKDTRVCYYCREVGHQANKCKQRVKCKGCGGDQHSYNRCTEQTTTCKKCDLVGHNGLVHETQDPVQRKKPQWIFPFFTANDRYEKAQKRLHQGATKRRNSWEESSRKGEKSSSSSRSREVRDKYPRVEKGEKGKSSRRTM